MTGRLFVGGSSVPDLAHIVPIFLFPDAQLPRRITFGRCDTAYTCTASQHYI